MDEDKKKYGFTRERSFRLYNMQLYKDIEFTRDPWEMPIIKNDHYIPESIFSFNYALSKNNFEQGSGIHFFIDDYQFFRIWRAPERYIDLFKRYGCIFTPDFSCYRDMKTPQIIYNIYCSRLIGAFYQAQGIKVIPTISWSYSDSFKYAFKGIPEGSIVAISTVGIYRDKIGRFLFERGVKEMVKQIKPETIIIYGKEIEIDLKDTNIVYFDSTNSRWEDKTKC